MVLIGMFDSPFVRRVAISMCLLGVKFEHYNWSVGKDQAKIRKYNPLGRVPVLLLDDGEALTESAAILDYLDGSVGPLHALLPDTGLPRRNALQCMALAIGAAEKGRDALYETLRPADKFFPIWLERLTVQMHAGLAELDKMYCAIPEGTWLLGTQLSQADITTVCVCTFLEDAVGVNFQELYPSLKRFMQLAEALPEFLELRCAFFPMT